MKRLLFTLTIFLLSAGMASGASMIRSETVTATGGTAAYAIAVTKNLAKPVLVSLGWTVTDASADIDILAGTGTDTVSTAAISASATTFGVSSCTGLNESTLVVIANTNGDTSEVAAVSACAASVITVGALTNAYRIRASVHEIESVWTHSNVGVGSGFLDGDPLFVGTADGPLVGKMSAVSGTGTIDFMTVDYR